MHKGSCLCGAVSFEVKGDLPPPSACHCTQCRKHSGHFEASTDLPRSVVTIKGKENLTRRLKNGKETIRIISARQASRKERKAYSG